MPRHIVDLSARSQVFREQRLLSHAWVASPADVMHFIQSPRSELKKLGIRLASTCRIETVLENHDWFTGHLTSNNGVISVFCRGEGDGDQFYRVALYASKASVNLPARELLHSPEEQEKPIRRVSPRGRIRIDVTRRSMLASPVHLKVHEWLSVFAFDAPATKSLEEAHRILVAITNAVGGALRSHAMLEAAATKVAETVNRPFNPAYSLVFRSHPSVKEPFHSVFATLMYAKALYIVQTSGWHYDALLEDSLNFLKQPHKTLAVLERGLQAVGLDFIGHLTMEAAIRRDTDSFFARQMDRAKEMFARHYPKYPEQCPHFSRRGRGLEMFGASNSSAWWFLPGLVAFAIVAWPNDVHQAKDLERF